MAMRRFSGDYLYRIMKIIRWCRYGLPFLVLFLLLPSSACPQSSLTGEISISGAFALYPMAVRWAEEFKKIHPQVRIDISAGGAGKGIADVLGGMTDIGMVSREIYPEESHRGALPIAVAKDAVVAVINAGNPGLAEILSRGLSHRSGMRLWITGERTTWKEVFGIAFAGPIHVYTRSDAAGAAEMWAKYFAKKQEDLQGTGVFSDPGLAQAVKKDAMGIGYNNIGYAFDAKSKRQIPGIRIVPLDLNDNGRVDPEENFYDHMDRLIEAIASGRYPSPPARELYFVIKGKPSKKTIGEFLRWVLSDGQKFVRESGYVSLSPENLQIQTKKLN